MDIKINVWFFFLVVGVCKIFYVCLDKYIIWSYNYIKLYIVYYIIYNIKRCFIYLLFLNGVLY